MSTKKFDVQLPYVVRLALAVATSVAVSTVGGRNVPVLLRLEERRTNLRFVKKFRIRFEGGIRTDIALLARPDEDILVMQARIQVGAVGGGGKVMRVFGPSRLEALRLSSSVGWHHPHVWRVSGG